MTRVREIPGTVFRPKRRGLRFPMIGFAQSALLKEGFRGCQEATQK
jgi:hypothetical protein